MECPYCGAPGVDDYSGCQRMMDEMTAQAFGNALVFALHRLQVDCYSLQHPEIYCVSAKSYAAHLTGVCCAIEHESTAEINAAVQKWLNGKKEMTKPPVPPPHCRGSLTIAHLRSARDWTDQKKRLGEWASNIWQAYSELHDVARSYIRTALAAAG